MKNFLNKLKAICLQNKVATTCFVVLFSVVLFLCSETVSLASVACLALAACALCILLARRAAQRYLDGLTRDESKILEQTLIRSKGGVDNLDNIINGLAESNPLYKQIGTVGEKLLEIFNNAAKWL